MCVEREFGILKGRWMLTMKWSDVALKDILDIIVIYGLPQFMYWKQWGNWRAMDCKKQEMFFYPK